MKNIIRIYKSIFKWVPWSAAFTAFQRLYEAFMPAAVTLISVALFENAARVIGGGRDYTGLYLYAGLYLIVYLISDIFNYIISITVNCGIYEKGTAFFRMELYEKISRLPLITFENADMLNKKERADKAINDETLSSVFNRTQLFTKSAIAVFGVAAVLARYSLWLLPLSLLSVLPYLFARMIRGREFFYVKSKQAKKTRLQAYLWNLFTTQQTAKEMRVMGFDGYIMEKWRDTRDEVNEELWALQKKDAVSLLWCDGVRIAGYCISVAVVLWLVIQGRLSLGVFGASLAAFLSLQNNMKDFLTDLGRIPEQMSYVADYYTFLDSPEEADGSVAYPGLSKDILLRNVSFKYPNSVNNALNQINLRIKKGEKIAILGENGSGKTTLSKVLLGLYPPESGKVLYDGVPAGDFAKDSFYSGISAIAQDFVSYSLSLRENVAVSDLPRLYDDDAIVSALSGAGVDIERSLDETMGREFGGRELSGGQWQKLAIARGLFKNSELIVLDEPTSALDPLIETEILSKFIEASEKKTAIIISHRVGLCKLVDRIIVMRNGDIVEDGTHETLLAADGEYARLYGAQAKWYN